MAANWSTERIRVVDRGSQKSASQIKNEWAGKLRTRHMQTAARHPQQSGGRELLRILSISLACYGDVNTARRVIRAFKGIRFKFTQSLGMTETVARQL